MEQAILPDISLGDETDGSLGDFKDRPIAPVALIQPAEGRPAYALLTGVVVSGAGIVPPGHLLLDSMSLIHLFSDPALVSPTSVRRTTR